MSAGVVTSPFYTSTSSCVQYVFPASFLIITLNLWKSMIWCLCTCRLDGLLATSGENCISVLCCSDYIISAVSGWNGWGLLTDQGASGRYFWVIFSGHLEKERKTVGCLLLSAFRPWRAKPAPYLMLSLCAADWHGQSSGYLDRMTTYLYPLWHLACWCHNGVCGSDKATLEVSL